MKRLNPETVTAALRRTHSLFVSPVEASRITTALSADDTRRVPAEGRDIVTGMKRTVAIGSEDIDPPDEPVPADQLG